MIRYSVLIPARDAADELAEHLPALCAELERLALPYEVICIDDGSRAPSVVALEHMLAQYAWLRVLRFDEPRGVSAALSVGIAAARGGVIVAMPPGRTYRVDQIPHLIARLSRGDLVFGRRRAGALAKLWQRVSRFPRWLLLGLEVRDPTCLFWAARREAVAGLELARGMFRYLPWLVAQRGYRVSEIVVDSVGSARMADSWANPADLLAAWWLRRRWRPLEVRELAPAPPAILPIETHRPAPAEASLVDASAAVRNTA